MSALPVIAVFDTNNLVRLALAKTRASQRMLGAIKSELFGLVMSESTLAEIERVLNYPRIRIPQKLDDDFIGGFIEILKESAVFTDDLYEVDRVEDDPDDNIFLACAMEGGADYLVSEDQHLRKIKYYHGVQIIGLADFYKILGL